MRANARPAVLEGVSQDDLQQQGRKGFYFAVLLASEVSDHEEVINASEITSFLVAEGGERRLP